MDHAHPLSSPFPWRATAVAAGAVALVELAALIAIGLIHIAPHAAPAATTAAAAAPTVPVHATTAPVHRVAQPPAVPLRPHSAVRVLVLNGNGVNGAAAAAAARLQGAGYRIGGAADAARHDYAQSIVMYVPGWAKEAHRLAREAGVRLVSPVDGLRPSQLRGSKLILLLGN